jgi:hypothetical protein
MPVLLILLLLGVLAYLYWRRKTTTLTRECRWRRTAVGQWRCAFCGAEFASDDSPIVCLKRENGLAGKK